MAIIVQNVIQMEGIASLPLFTEKIGSLEFDFNKLLPMPESLDVEAGSLENVAIEAVIRKVAHRSHPFQKAQAVPAMSDEQFAKQVAIHARPEDELCKLGLQYISNKVLYGAATWYDWCCQNWGTRSNAYHTKVANDDMLIFTTSWIPPIRVIGALAQRYPQAVIRHWWADEEIGNNAGYAKYSQEKAETKEFYVDGSSEAYDTYAFCWATAPSYIKMNVGNATGATDGRIL